MSDKLYQAAFAFRSTKIWERFHDTEVFAVRFYDGELGYCSILGGGMGDISLVAYIGEEGVQSLYNLFLSQEYVTPAQEMEQMLSQRCLKCDFTNTDAFEKEELADVRSYAKKNGISLRGKNRFPKFIRYVPNRLPVSDFNDKEEDYLCQALSAVVELSARAMTAEEKRELGFEDIRFSDKSVPMIALAENGELSFLKTKLPDKKTEPHPKAIFHDEIALQKLKKLKKSGSWACEVCLTAVPVETDNEAPFYAYFILLTELEKNNLILTDTVQDYQRDAEKLLNGFANKILENNMLPKRLLVPDQRTYFLMQDLSKKLGIKLEVVPQTPELEEIENSYYQTEELLEEMDGFFDFLISMPQQDFNKIPDDVKGMLWKLDKAGMLPPELSKKLAHLSEKKAVQKKKSRKKSYGSISYVISVSVMSGSYRHLKVSANMMLEDFAEAILEVFDFADDHMYAFHMDNRGWDSQDIYTRCPEELFGWDDRPQRGVNGVHLGDLELMRDKRFKFLFDFGDEWWFQCRVLKVLDEETDAYSVVRSKGEPPEQYPDYDDEWD